MPPRLEFVAVGIHDARRLLRESTSRVTARRATRAYRFCAIDEQTRARYSIAGQYRPAQCANSSRARHGRSTGQCRCAHTRQRRRRRPGNAGYARAPWNVRQVTSVDRAAAVEETDRPAGSWYHIDRFDDRGSDCHRFHGYRALRPYRAVTQAAGTKTVHSEVAAQLDSGCCRLEIRRAG